MTSCPQLDPSGIALALVCFRGIALKQCKHEKPRLFHVAFVGLSGAGKHVRKSSGMAPNAFALGRRRRSPAIDVVPTHSADLANFSKVHAPALHWARYPALPDAGFSPVLPESWKAGRLEQAGHGR
ncbi:hypothetical protein PMIN06_013156 [Paraphaeosphaeria minitans]